MKRTRPKHTTGWLLFALLIGAGGNALAGERPVAATSALPAWEQLSPAQREILLAPLRERWNANPAERARMLEHATRWQALSPEQRKRAHRGLHRWERMDPQHRREMRALFGKMRQLSPEQRKALRAKWHAMTPEQRRAWVEANPPKQD